METLSENREKNPRVRQNYVDKLYLLVPEFLSHFQTHTRVPIMNILAL